MDTLAAKDQENFVHGLQTQAASKPLNAGLKTARTPAIKAPKTPFKIPLNDENAFAKGGKSLLQTKGKADAKLDRNAFVTPAGASRPWPFRLPGHTLTQPAGPRTRAPLGMKTTNAKATAFQTPAPLSASAKTQKASPRLRRPKVKVQPDALTVDQDDVPDVEYMPPKETPLPDDYDYLPRDWNIPKLESGGVWEAYHNPLEDDGRTRLERRFEESLARDKKKRDANFERTFDEHMEKEEAELARHFGVELPKKFAPKSAPQVALKTTADRKKPTGPSTLKARSAVAALSEPRERAYVAPTTATKSRLPTKTVTSRKPTVVPSATHRAAAAAASKSTIGYAQGRENALNKTHARKPLSNVIKPAPFSVAANRASAPSSSFPHHRNVSTSSVGSKARGAISRSSSMSTNATLVAQPQEEVTSRTAQDIERELELMLLRDNEEDEEIWANSFNNQLGGCDAFDDSLDDFQLQLPEGL
ncbi:hypothetical protein GRF29_1536g1517996 [Pseudopithomyces chartarum]|uniref:Uncharacterized protein n=1 Tax=Pseudopithomyces chartarum TaxID=1892770 RepID=A0AAN6LQW1_9PLEO|nr:hypothetical protein GRF29_1536g1517996 [Pseudopithomyces chartarum]